MVLSKKDLLCEEIVEGFVEFKPDKVKESIHEAIQNGIDAFSIQEDGLRRGLERLGELFERNEVFLPHLMFAAKTFKEGSDLLKPFLLKNQSSSNLGTAVLGTVFGDLHDLGKNLVGLMWEVSGLKVIDLGINVSGDTFIKTVREYQPKILGLSSLLTTTMLQQRNVIEALVEAHLRDTVKVMVGGAPVSERWAKEIGADGFARDAGEASRIAKKLITNA